MAAEQNFKDYLLTELKYYASGNLSETDMTPEKLIFKTLREERNGVKAEAISQTQALEPLVQLSVLLNRGRFLEAGQIIEDFDVTSVTEEKKHEFYALCGRYYNYMGEWQSSVEACQKGLDLKPSGVTVLSYLMTQAVSLFEMGEFVRAQINIKQVIALADLYPYLTLVDYARVLDAKITALLEGEKNARKKLLRDVELLQRKKRLNLDSLLAGLRTQIDIDRLAGVKHSNAAMACYVIASLMGEDLYKEMAWTDYMVSKRDLSALEQYLPRARRFTKISHMIEDVRSQHSRSVTTQLMIDYINGGESELAADEVLERPDTEQYKKIIWLDASLMINIEENSIEPLKLGAKQESFLRAIKDGMDSKEEIFCHVWEMKKFTKRLHDNVIHCTLSRMNKKIGTDFKTEAGKISCSHSLIV